MSEIDLAGIAKQLVQKGKGILAADESLRTAGKRLSAIGLPNSEENRRLYRQLFFTTPGAEECLSGIILFEETFGHKTDEGEGLVKRLEKKGIIPGIKVDKGTVELVNFEPEVMTQGLDGLRERLADFARGGARFTKWRAVVRIGEGLPTRTSLEMNAIDMARYAAMSQGAGMVPIVEPEVLLEGKHGLARAQEVTEAALKVTFEELRNFKVDLTGLILKTSMVVPGDESGEEMDAGLVAEGTIRVLRAVVPEEVPGVVFLSGGQTAEQATNNLNEIAKQGEQPWEITFSFARALQAEPLSVWKGEKDNWAAAQDKFLERLKETAEARKGVYQH